MVIENYVQKQLHNNINIMIYEDVNVIVPNAIIIGTLLSMMYSSKLVTNIHPLSLIFTSRLWFLNLQNKQSPTNAIK